VRNRITGIEHRDYRENLQDEFFLKPVYKQQKTGPGSPVLRQKRIG
jgi:hypothetical protein